MRRIGVHVSIAGGLRLAPERAHALGCTCMQIFSHSPRIWAVSAIRPDEAIAFAEARARLDIAPVFVHASYLLNIASADESLRQRSADMLREEMKRAEEIGAEFVVLHPGTAHDGQGRGRASQSIIEALKGMRFKTGLLIENTSGKRGDIAATPRELGEIVAGAGGLVAGVCIDTCHAYSAGFDFRDEGIGRLASELEEYLGLSLLRLVHLNDSKSPLGSGIDRHEDIGAGHIGALALGELLHHAAFRDAPVVLETPKESDGDDLRNLASARALID